VNAPHIFPRTVDPLASPVRYAHAFLSGERDPRPAVDYQPLYSDDEWTEAAFAALDGDTADLTFYHYREEAFQAFQVWQREDYARREFDDFSAFLVRNARLYAGALDRAEQRLAAMQGRIAS
jgi:hypothetical protein